MKRTRSGAAGEEKAANQNGAEQRLAGAGGHLEEKLAAAGVVVRLGNLVQRTDLIAAQRQIWTYSA